MSRIAGRFAMVFAANSARLTSVAWLACIACLAGCSGAKSLSGGGSSPGTRYSWETTADTATWPIHAVAASNPSAAYQWLDVILEASARRVDRTIAKPTIISREMVISCTAMFDAWACYDDKAVGTRLGGKLRRPATERTQANKERAMAQAVIRCLEDVFPEDKPWIAEIAKQKGVDIANTFTDPSTPEGVGNAVAAAIVAYRHHDGANQLGDEKGSTGESYSDTTGYKPHRAPGEEQDPDRWMPISFADPKDPRAPRITPPGLTPHWGKVKLVGLDASDRPQLPGPPRASSAQMRKEVDECIEANANLSLYQKAVVEFMRDGPRSTGQSGHWLRFAQDLSRRDKHGLDQDVKLFFAVACMAFDAFVVCWDEKYRFDSSRPYWYVRWFYKGQKVKGYAGPCLGVKTILAEEWNPYSPDTFVTPPFPGYPSGHATVSGAASTILALFSGSDRFEFVAKKQAGELTEASCSTYEMQAIEGIRNPRVAATRAIDLPLPTFSSTAEMAAESRMLGGYHIRADNEDGLKLGRHIAARAWPRYKAYWEGTAPDPH